MTRAEKIHTLVVRLHVDGDMSGTIDVHKSSDAFLASAGGMMIQLQGSFDLLDEFAVSFLEKKSERKSKRTRRQTSS